jgi:hypothetical protein
LSFPRPTPPPLYAAKNFNPLRGQKPQKKLIYDIAGRHFN